MNREQRRRQQRQHKDEVRMINLNDITYPQQMTVEQCEAVLAMRLADNLNETGHPFHHLTASGVIVTPDPTQEYLLSRLPAEKQKAIREGWLKRVQANAPEARPVNRKYYGHDPYERH